MLEVQFSDCFLTSLFFFFTKVFCVSLFLHIVKEKTNFFDLTCVYEGFLAGWTRKRLNENKGGELELLEILCFFLRRVFFKKRKNILMFRFFCYVMSYKTLMTMCLYVWLTMWLLVFFEYTLPSHVTKTLGIERYTRIPWQSSANK